MLGKIIYKILANAAGAYTGHSLEVYTAKQVELHELKDAFAQMKLQAIKDESQEYALELRPTGLLARLGQPIKVSHPNELDPDFVPRSIANIIEHPNWAYEICVPEQVEKSVMTVMNKIAQTIADRGQGFVLDNGVTTYKSPSMVASKQEKHYLEVHEQNQIKLEWFIPAEQVPEDLLLSVFRLWEQLEPKSLPNKYNFGSKSAPPMSREFCATLAKGPGDWNAKLPCIGGYFKTAVDTRKWRTLPKQYARCHKLIFEMLADVAIDNEQMAQKVEKILIETALLTKSFFAAATLQRHDGNPNGFEGIYFRDNYFLEYSPLWLGLPVLPVWLGWYGKTYFALVKEHLLAHPEAQIVQDHHIFLKMNNLPLNLDELRSVFPALPANLLLKEEPHQAADGRILMGSRKYIPADYVPKVEED